MNYQQDFWKPEPSSYVTTSEGWALFKDDYAADILSLKKLCPELVSWGDIECINAWAGYCSDCNFTEWTEPNRSEQFLVYLKLAQEGKLPDCSEDQEAIYQLIMDMPLVSRFIRHDFLLDHVELSNTSLIAQMYIISAPIDEITGF